ncbi:MAG: hypothetical protein ACLQED_00815 [Desulfobaccales bacterium]
MAGWFRDPGEAAKIACRVEAKGIYITLNPCQEALLARANQRLIAQVDRTADDHIKRFKNLLIDVDADPGGVSGVSSINAEHNAALEMAAVIRADLSKEGWPEPLVGDSGNGGHLIYSLDLSNDDESKKLVQAVLEALALRYADDLAQHNLGIDTSVFNPARLTKLYGTVVRKGENIEARPHRLAKILSLPETRKIVPLELLKRMAASVPSQEKPQAPNAEAGTGRLNVEAYLKHYRVDMVKVKPQDGGLLYCLQECVFDPSHSDNQAAIFQAADGKLSYQCFHKSCKGHTWAEARAKISGSDKLAEFIIGGLAKENTPKKPKQPTQAELLIKLAGDAELFHDMNRKGYATIPVGNHIETWPIKSMAFRDWLRGRFYKAQGTTPGGQALQDTLDQLAAQARFDGQELEIYVRVAHMGGKIYVDLANESWQGVEITPQRWLVVDNPPVKFRRPRGLAPMPTPEPGGNLADLKPFINCRDEDWPLVVAWLIGAYSPGPYPALIFQGEQGTAKSTTARALKNVVDPGHSPQRTAPRDIRDLMISASNSWCLSFDNLSDLKDWLSDGFCRLATGGGLSTRELYSDDNETILDAMRPVILNGIDSLVSRGDLADRATLLELPQIEKRRRRREADLWQAFETAQPGILGAVFNALSAALANVHGVKLPELPRMADFATWVVAAEPALPWEPGTFLAAYTQNRAAIVEHSLEGDVVAVAVRSFMEHRQEWEGTPTELLNELTDVAGELVSRGKAWPKAANSLSNRLRRANTFLRAVGIEIERGKSGPRLISIRKGKQKTVQTVQTVQVKEPSGFAPDDPLDDPIRLDDPTVQMDDPGKRPSTRKATTGKALDDADAVDDKIQTLSKTDDVLVTGEAVDPLGGEM